MKNINKKEILKKLALDFDKYEYYYSGKLYRYSKKKKTSEFFNKKTMKWELSDINIREYLIYWWDLWDWDPLDPNRNDTSFPKTKEELLKGYLNLTQQEINEYEWQEHKKALEKQVKEYLNKGKSIPAKLFITVVADCPDTTLARKIIPLQKNINAKDKYGQTALHHCAMSAGDGVMKTVKLLLKHGANINAKDKEGNRPVDCVLPEAWEGDTKNMDKMIKLLTPPMTDIEKQRKIAQSRAERLEEREFTPEEEKYYANLAKDWVIGSKKKYNSTKTKTSKLVEKYLELGKQVFLATEKGKSGDEIRNEMQEIKKRFSADDWDDLIKQSPVHIRPMIAEQKKKYIKNKKDNKKMSKLLKEYEELSCRLGDKDITKKEETKVVKKMKELEKKFTKADWDELIASVPLFIRPMVSEQKKKHLNKGNK